MNSVTKLHKKVEGDGDVALFIPRPSHSETIHLLPGRKGPRGLVLSGDEKGVVAVFNKEKVRKYLEKTFSNLFDK